MTDTFKLECNTAEEVAYKLTHKILGGGERDEAKILKTYAKCLKIVRGYEYDDLDDN
jgi:hypothetical protein